MITVEEQNAVDPICPHCNTEIKKLLFQRLPGMLGVRYLYFCSKCRAVLGVSHRKGFWMG